MNTFDNLDTQSPDSPPTELPDIPQQVKKFPDGSVYVREAPQLQEAVFLNDQENIIKEIDPNELAIMADQIYKLVEADEQSYIPFYQEANAFLNLLGLNNDDGSLQPLLHEGMDPELKSSALIKTFTNLILSIGQQLFPLNGLTDTQIKGKTSPYAEKRAEVKKEFVNDYFDHHLKDFREEGYRVIAWALVFGYGVKKVYIDPITLKPTSKFIKNNDFIIHYDHSSSFGAQRKTHRITLTQREYALRCLTGFYLNEAELADDDNTTDLINQALQKIQSVNPDNSEDENKNYEIWEVECDYRLKTYKGAEGYDIPLTYILSIDKKTRKPVRLVPNWHKNDPLKKSLSPYIIYPLVPFLSGLGLGLLHLCGAAATASSDILQILIRAGEFSTEPAGLLNSNVRITQTDIGKMIPGKYQTVMSSGPIQENFVEINSKEPSPTLKEVREGLDNYILSISSLTADQLDHLSDQAAITIMSLITEIQRTPNAILQRFYQAFSEELSLFNGLFYEWLGANQSFEFLGKTDVFQVTQQDFISYPITNPDGSVIPVINLVPAAEPSMKNSTYRLLESNVILGYAIQQPQLFNMPEIMRFVFSNMELDEALITSLLAPPPQVAPPPPAVDPVTENQNILAGKPVKAYPFQDQQAYITVNSLLLNYPDPQIVANTQALIQERYGYMLLNQFQQVLGQPMPPDPSQLSPEQQNQLALAAANAVQQNLLTTPGVAPKPAMEPKDEIQLEKNRNDYQIAVHENQIKEKRINTDLEIARLEAETTAKKSDQESQEVTLKYAFEQHKLDYEHQINEKTAYLKMELDKEKHERENLSAIVTLLREAVEQISKPDQLVKGDKNENG